eukprot:gene30919-37367_t
MSHQQLRIRKRVHAILNANRTSANRTKILRHHSDGLGQQQLEHSEETDNLWNAVNDFDSSYIGSSNMANNYEEEEDEEEKDVNTYWEETAVESCDDDDEDDDDDDDDSDDDVSCRAETLNDRLSYQLDYCYDPTFGATIMCKVSLLYRDDASDSRTTFPYFPRVQQSYGNHFPSENQLNDYFEKRSFWTSLDTNGLMSHLKSITQTQSIMVNILLSVNFDGVQLHKSNTDASNPLLISIMNLPPNFRNIKGIGIFTLTAMSVKPESPVADFLISLLVQELELLCKGIKVTIRGVTFFVQARLICHVYDTRALEKVLKVQGAGSYGLCVVCGIVQGWGKKQFDKVSYQNHRMLLPYEHILNYIGQSGKCCPEDYFSSTAIRDEVENSFVNSAARRQNEATNWQPFTAGYRNDEEVETLLNSMCGKKDLQKRKVLIKAFLRGDEAWTWFHDCKGPYKFIHFVPNIYFPFCDLRPRAQIANRVTREQYRHNAQIAAMSDNKKAEARVWLYDGLSYSNPATQVNFDPFHCLMGVGKYLIRTLLNISSTKNKSRKSRKSRDISCQPKVIHIVECCFDYITFIVGSLCDEDEKCKQYLLLYRMLSSLYARLLAPVVLEKQIDHLHKLAIESIATYSGMLPPSYTDFVHHEVVDLAPYIRVHGPLRCWWSLPAERAMAQVKKLYPKGGHYYDLTAQKRIFNDEHLRLSSFYNNFSNRKEVLCDVLKCSAEHHVGLKKTGNSTSGGLMKMFEFDEFVFRMECRRCLSASLTHFPSLKRYHGYVQAKFLQFLVEESMRIYRLNLCSEYLEETYKEISSDLCDSDRSLMEVSSIYRLFKFFQSHHDDFLCTIPTGSEMPQKAKCSRKASDFFYWLVEFWNVISSQEESKITELDNHRRPTWREYKIVQTKPSNKDVSSGNCIWREDMNNAQKLLQLL